MGRQSSLPSASSDLSLPETNLDWSDHIIIDGERVDLKKKIPVMYSLSDGTPGTDTFIKDPLLTPHSIQKSNPSTSTPQQQPINQKAQEPNIDLELDVKVFISSGKCVLHTKDNIKDEELKLSRMRKDRSCSAGLLEFPTTSGSPDPPRRNKEKHTNQSSSSRLRNTPHATLVDLTIFHIPGMDVKLQYQSKVMNLQIL